jgi:hypothetical protein
LLYNMCLIVFISVFLPRRLWGRCAICLLDSLYLTSYVRMGDMSCWVLYLCL